MTGIWATAAALFAGTVLLKAAGPLLLGARRPADRVMGVIALVAPSVLTGLIVYETLSGERSGIVVDARVPGVTFARPGASRTISDMTV